MGVLQEEGLGTDDEVAQEGSRLLGFRNLGCYLKKRLSTKRRHMPVGHAVAKDDEVADRPNARPPLRGGSRMYLSV